MKMKKKFKTLSNIKNWYRKLNLDAIKGKLMVTKRTKVVAWLRNFKAAILHLEHRQKWDSPEVIVADNPNRCKHCGAHYNGGYCPKCGLPARWKRFTWKLLILNFLDIWGLGNRPMFRTIRDLFWRPGFMMRDYLRGHHLSYFPPFKLLALLTVLMVFAGWALHVTLGEPVLIADRIEYLLNNFKSQPALDISANAEMVVSTIRQAEEFFGEHLLYRILVQNALLVLVVWVVFHKISRLNLVETFFSQIYINCQFLIIGIITLVITRKFSLGYLFPYAVPLNLMALTPILLTYDFHQLYDLNWLQSIWRVLLVCIGIVLLYSFGLSIVAVLLAPSLIEVLLWFLILAIDLIGLHYVIRNLRRQRAQLSKSMYYVGLIFSVPVLTMPFSVDTESVWWDLVGFVLCLAATLGICWGGVYIYKKYHRTWLAVLFYILAYTIVGSIIDLV